MNTDISKIKIDEMSVPDNVRLKGRAREVFCALYEYLKPLPHGYMLPSVKELQKKFSAGQLTVVTAIEQLKQMNLLEAKPRKGLIALKPERKWNSEEIGEDSFSPVFIRSSREPVFGMQEKHHPVWEKIVDRFNRSHTRNIKMGYYKNYSELASKNRESDFDIICFPSNPMLSAEHCSPREYVNLDDFVKRLNPNEIYPTAFIRDMEGRLWGIGSGLFSFLMVYNKELFRKFGIPEPAVNSSWEDLFVKGKALKAASGCYGLVFSGYMSYFFHQGIHLADAETGKILFEKERIAAAMQFLRKVIQEEKIAPAYSELYQNSMQDHIFEQGQAAVAEIGSFLLKNIRNSAAFEFGAIPVPLAPCAKRPVYSDQLSIRVESLNFDICWDFIQFVISEEGQTYLAEEFTNLPVRKGVKPEKTSREIYEIQVESALRGERRFEDNFLPLKVRFAIEASIDRWIKYGGNLNNALDEIEKTANWLIQSGK